jgi:hypothetical protein
MSALTRDGIFSVIEPSFDQQVTLQVLQPQPTKAECLLSDGEVYLKVELGARPLADLDSALV